MTLFDFKKIFLSIKEHKKDTILIFLIVFVLTIFTTIFYVFYLSSEQMSKSISDNVRVGIKVTGGSLGGGDADYLNTVFEYYDINYDDYKTYFTNIYNYVERLANYQGVEEYGNVFYIKLLCEKVSSEYIDVANANKRLFDSDLLVVDEGRFFDDNEIEGGSNNILVKKDLTIEDNDGNFKTVEVGDIITLKNGIDDEYEFNVIGIFSKQNDEQILSGTDYYSVGTTYFILPLNDMVKIATVDNDMNSSDISVSVIGVDNANTVKKYLEDILKDMTIKDKLSLGNHDITVDDSMARQLEKPIKTIQILFECISIIMIFIMFVLLCSFLITVINKRLHDFGIFISLGQCKFKTIFSFLIEVFIISSLAFILSTPLSYKVSESVSKQMVEANLKRQQRIATISGDEEQIDIFKATKDAYDDYTLSITSNDVLLIYAYTNLIIVVSSLAALISIAKINPKELLKK